MYIECSSCISEAMASRRGIGSRCSQGKVRPAKNIGIVDMKVVQESCRRTATKRAPSVLQNLNNFGNDKLPSLQSPKCGGLQMNAPARQAGIRGLNE